MLNELEKTLNCNNYLVTYMSSAMHILKFEQYTISSVLLQTFVTVMKVCLLITI